MKKVAFMFFVVLGIALTSCSCFDSEPVNPRIIGVGNLQYDAKMGLWYVAIASNRYVITQVTFPDYNPRSVSTTQDVEPVEGMLVTVFTSKEKIGVQAVAGKQSVQQIEALYHTNSTVAVILFSLLGLCFSLMLFLPHKKAHAKNTDV